MMRVGGFEIKGQVVPSYPFRRLINNNNKEKERKEQKHPRSFLIEIKSDAKVARCRAPPNV
jgi:hypothetical protein